MLDRPHGFPLLGHDGSVKLRTECLDRRLGLSPMKPGESWRDLANASECGRWWIRRLRGTRWNRRRFWRFLASVQFPLGSRSFNNNNM
jgi:hypothetical protein